MDKCKKMQCFLISIKAEDNSQSFFLLLTALIMKEKYSLIQLLAIINACVGTHIIEYL